MTTQPEPSDRVPATPPGADRDASPSPFDLSDLIAAGDIDVVPGDPPVPITVWRAADADSRFGHDLADGLTPHLAALLVGCHTRPGDTVVSLRHDPALAGAAGRAGCTYLSVDRPADLADLDHVAGSVRLVVLSWPTPHGPTQADPTELTDLFTACRLLLARGGCTIVVLAALPADSDYTEHSHRLIPAAQRAGLGWLQHIIAITAPIVGDRIVWRAAPADAASIRGATHLTVHVDLLVFVVRGGRHA
jgi:hypothetical protein